MEFADLLPRHMNHSGSCTVIDPDKKRCGLTARYQVKLTDKDGRSVVSFVCVDHLSAAECKELGIKRKKAA